MAAPNKNILVVNVLFWIVAASLHPISRLIPTGSGEPPKIFAVLIPIAFLLFAFGTTAMIAIALREQKGQ
jgi:hypothetical protein